MTSFSGKQLRTYSMDDPVSVQEHECLEIECYKSRRVASESRPTHVQQALDVRQYFRCIANCLLVGKVPPSSKVDICEYEDSLGMLVRRKDLPWHHHKPVGFVGNELENWDYAITKFWIIRTLLMEES